MFGNRHYNMLEKEQLNYPFNTFDFVIEKTNLVSHFIINPYQRNKNCQ